MTASFQGFAVASGFLTLSDTPPEGFARGNGRVEAVDRTRHDRGTATDFGTMLSRLVCCRGTIRRAKGGVQCLNNGLHLGPHNLVINRCPVPARFDKAITAQPHEVLRQRNLVDLEAVAQIGHGFLAIHQRAKHQKALRVRQASHQVSRQMRRRYHLFYIHILEFILFECYVQG